MNVNLFTFHSYLAYCNNTLYITYFQLLTDIDEAFHLFDTDQSGMLRTFRLAKALRIANMYPTDKDVRKILKNMGYPSTFFNYSTMLPETNKIVF